MLQAIASILEDEHRRWIEEIQHELNSRFGVRTKFAGQYPHFSYQVSRGYNVDRIQELLADYAAQTEPFVVETSGLAVFTGKRPVLYLLVVRDPGLSWLHRMLWRETIGSCNDPAAYYRPERWVPHITLAYGEGLGEQIPDIYRWLVDYDFDWRVPVRNLALIQGGDASSKLLAQYPLMGTAGPQFGIEP